MKLDEATLAKMEPVAQEDGGEGTPAPEGTPEGEPKGEGTEEPTGEETPAPEGEAPVTMESYIAAAPPEFRDVLTNGLAAHTAAKEELITKITANDNNKFTKEFLATKGLQELRGLVALADNGAKKENDVKPPMFYGAATPTGVPVTNDDVTEEPLVVPTMNFANEEAAAV